MIKINLSKVRKEEKRIPLALDLRGLSPQRLFTVGGEYYAGIVAWIALVVVLGYYWKVKGDIDTLKRELNRLNQEKVALQVQAKKFIEEKKNLENSIASIKKEIQEIEKSKDIIVGLKSYYNVFNSSFDYYTLLPATSWFSLYKQTLDIEKEAIKVELDLNSFDYQSISKYGDLLSKNSRSVELSQMERRVNPYGFEYYVVKFFAEKPLQGGR